MIHFVNVEDKIEFADVGEALVEGLDKDLDEIENTKLALALIHCKDEVKGRVVPIDQSHVATPDCVAFKEIAKRVGTLGHSSETRLDGFLLFLEGHLIVEPRQARLALVVHHLDARVFQDSKGSMR